MSHYHMIPYLTPQSQGGKNIMPSIFEGPQVVFLDG